MGLQSWKKEFYPISAEEVIRSDDARTIIAHSLQKWVGLLPKNMQKHNVVFDEVGVRSKRAPDIYPTPRLLVNDETCSLCQKYQRDFDAWGDGVSHPCAKCPLYKVRGKVPCYSPKFSEKDSPFSAFVSDFGDNDPRPMIKWLKKALAVEVAKQKKRAKRVKKAKK